MKLVKLFALAAIFFFVAQSASAQSPVLAELFRNVNCGNCKPEEDQYENYLNSHPNVILIYYHNLITLSTDPFYLASKADVDARSNVFYKIGANPHAFINGKNAQSSATAWKNSTNSEQTKTYPVQVTASLGQGANNKTFNVNVHTVGNAQNVSLYVALTESKIVYQNTHSYGSTLSGTWDHIFRKMLPTANGSAAMNLSGSQDFTYSFDTTGTSWNMSNMDVIVFVQDANAQADGISRVVEGAVSIPMGFDAVRPTASANSFALSNSYPNPFSTKTTVSFVNDRPSALKLQVVDLLGRVVSQMDKGTFPAGNSSFEFEPEGLTPGVYLLQVLRGGAVVGSTRITYMR